MMVMDVTYSGQTTAAIGDAGNTAPAASVRKGPECEGPTVAEALQSSPQNKWKIPLRKPE